MKIAFFGVALVCLIAGMPIGCGGDDDRAGGGKASVDAQREVSEAKGGRAAWETFKSTAKHDLEVVGRRLEAAREGLAEAERREIDRWAERVKSTREEIGKEVAEAPENRRRYQDQLRRDVEEIRDEGKALLAKIGVGKPASADGEPPG